MIGGNENRYDASPRGGDPGFVKAPGSATLLIPDAPGDAPEALEQMARRYKPDP